jgi:hypothetical protein
MKYAPSKCCCILFIFRQLYQVCFKWASRFLWLPVKWERYAIICIIIFILCMKQANLACYEFEVPHMHMLKARQSGCKMNLYVWCPVNANTCYVLIYKIAVMMVSWIAMIFQLIANQSIGKFWRDMNWALLLEDLCFISLFQVQNYMWKVLYRQSVLFRT